MNAEYKFKLQCILASYWDQLYNVIFGAILRCFPRRSHWDARCIRQLAGAKQYQVRYQLL